MTARLTHLRLPAFKSVLGARVHLDPLTLLVGRNGSGKSNVIDAMAVLSALASGAPIREALDGGRDGPLVRGGSEGCAPVGQDSFRIGCGAVIDGAVCRLDVTIAVRPSVQIASERLWTQHSAGARAGEPLDLLRTDPPGPDSADITARWHNGKQGPNPTLTFRATQLLTSQVAARVPSKTKAGQRVHDVAQQMLEAMRGVFILDPVPHQMRKYVPEKDVNLRRNAENLSAVLAALRNSKQAHIDMRGLVKSLSESHVSSIGFARSELGDVMAVLTERFDSKLFPVPARLMSDGTLRFLAVAAALLGRPQGAADQESRARAERLLVVEEIENGLHPSQVALLLDRLRASASLGVRTLATTHSPAILDALQGEDHSGVFVCSRDDSGWSRVTRLTDFPDYFEVAGKGSLGMAASRDRLRPRAEPETRLRPLADVLGL